jgi:hypothetical protein
MVCECGAEGPPGEDDIEAIDRWNTRAQAKAAPQAEPVAYADPVAFQNFKSRLCTKEWMWAKPDAGLVPLFDIPPAPDHIPDPTKMVDAELVELLEASLTYCVGEVFRRRVTEKLAQLRTKGDQP